MVFGIFLTLLLVQVEDGADAGDDSGDDSGGDDDDAEDEDEGEGMDVDRRCAALAVNADSSCRRDPGR